MLAMGLLLNIHHNSKWINMKFWKHLSWKLLRGCWLSLFSHSYFLLLWDYSVAKVQGGFSRTGEQFGNTVWEELQRAQLIECIVVFIDSLREQNSEIPWSVSDKMSGVLTLFGHTLVCLIPGKMKLRYCFE